jgi:hypothetical protein
MLAAAGCKKPGKIIEKATFKPSENLEVVRVSLVFGPKIQSDLAGGFAIKDYGYLFINPFTTSQPFEIGFDLNTKIVNDQDYIELTPTTVLPNGLPIGLPYAVVEIRAPNPISNKFDLFGYVDVLHTSWLGVAAMFAFLDDKYFPAGLSISQVFLRDAQGRPGVIASVFGPTLNNDGTLLRNGGIALFANVRQLIDQIGREERTFLAEDKVYLDGPMAPVYEQNPWQLLKLEANLLRGLNGR